DDVHTSFPYKPVLHQNYQPAETPPENVISMLFPKFVLDMHNSLNNLNNIPVSRLKPSLNNVKDRQKRRILQAIIHQINKVYYKITDSFEQMEVMIYPCLHLFHT